MMKTVESGKPKDQQQVDAVFDIVHKASDQMQRGEVADAFLTLDGIQRPNLDEWPAAIQQAYEHLRRANELADEAIAGKGNAADPWGRYGEACDAAAAAPRMYLSRTPSFAQIADSWPDVVTAFKNAITKRRVGNKP